MRLNNIEINSETEILEIDMKQFDTPFVVVVSDGQAKTTELPSFGVTSIITHQNKVKRVKFDEGEDF